MTAPPPRPTAPAWWRQTAFAAMLGVSAALMVAVLAVTVGAAVRAIRYMLGAW